MKLSDIRTRANIKIKIVTKLDKASWNFIVNNCKTSEIYHLYEWSELLERTYGIKVLKLIAYNENETIGFFPFAYFDTVLFAKKFVSLPFSDIGGLCVTNENYRLQIIKSIINIGKLEGVDFIEIRMLQQNDRDLKSSGFIEGFRAFTYLLDTNKPYEILRKQYHKKIRYNIRRALRDDLKVRESSNIHDIKIFYNIYLKAMKNFGTPPAPLSFWVNMWKIFYPLGMLKLIFTVKDDIEISGFIALLFQKKLYFTLNVSIPKYRSYLGLNDLLFDWYIRYACENGYKIVDFGRTRQGTGVQRFKEKGWGVKRISLNKYYFFFNNNRKNLLDEALYPKMSIYAKLWKLLMPSHIAPIFGYQFRRTFGDA